MQLRYLKYCQCLLGIICTLTAHAAPLASKSDLASLLNNMISVSAQVSQAVFDANDQLQSSTSGQLYLSKPGSLRWETTTPHKIAILIKNHQVWLYQAALKQVLVQNTNTYTAHPIAWLLTPNLAHTILKHYQIKNSAYKQHQLCYQLIAESPELQYDKINLCFYQDNLTSLSIHDQLGFTVILKLNHAIYNKPIPTPLFNLQIPHGTEIITTT